MPKTTVLGYVVKANREIQITATRRHPQKQYNGKQTLLDLPNPAGIENRFISSGDRPISL